MHPKDQIIEIMQRIYQHSMTTTSGGNLSILDDGNMWITPASIDKGKLTADDIVVVAKDGKVFGRHMPSSEYLFHHAVYERNTRIKAILHAHPPALAAFSIVRQVPDTRVIPQAFDICGTVGIVKYAPPGSQELADDIAQSFEEGHNTVLLENHGIVTGGEDLLSAFQRFETLDFCARIIIKAGILGKKILSLTDKQISLFYEVRNNLPEFYPKKHTNKELELRKEICDFAGRSYDQRLMTSTEGTLSTRLDADSFLITPYGVDRKYLTVENIVQIKDKHRESGKIPSRAILLHNFIYEVSNDISAIITAQAPNIMAYGVTGTKIDTRTLPENYILLRNIPIIQYGMQFGEDVASVVSSKTPVVILQNDAVLVTGPSILSAYDRLEVAERAAETLLNSISLGKPVLLDKQQVMDLDKKYR
jgi:L-fuculose-phosphate aldolase